MRDGFIFYKSFKDAIDYLPIEEQLVAYKAITSYALDGIGPNIEGPAMSVFILAKPQIDANQRKYENGKNGGRPKASNDQNDNQGQTEQKPNHNQTKTKHKPNVNENVNENVNGNDNAKVNDKVKNKRSSKPEKVQFAEFVSMTNDEHSSLVAKYGKHNAQRAIEILDNYKGANGKKYASDYRAILNWVVGRLEEDSRKQSTIFSQQKPKGEQNASNSDQPPGEQYGDYY